MDLSRKDFVKAKVLFKLARKEIYGGRHLSLDLLKHGFGKHEMGDVDAAVDELLRQGWLLAKPAHYGKQVMINLEYSAEIKKFITDALENLPPFSEMLKWMRF